VTLVVVVLGGIDQRGLGVICFGSPAAAKLAARHSTAPPLSVVRRRDRVIVTLAPRLRNALRQHYPGLRIASFADYGPELVRDLAEDEKVNAPFACVGDFDGNGLKDAALLLTNGRRRWRLVAFHQTNEGGFRPYRIGPHEGFPEGLTDNPTGKVYFYLVLHRPGTIRYPPSDDLSHLARLRLRHDGILGVWAEEASRLYYFRNGRYRWVQQGD
jgi:hypothetical protein